LRSIRLATPHAPLEAVDLAKPEPGPDKVVVRIEAAGICHSDAHYRSGDPATRALPITLGHEIAGVIESTGTAVDAERMGNGSAFTTSSAAAPATGVCGLVSSSASGTRCSG